MKVRILLAEEAPPGLVLRVLERLPVPFAGGVVGALGRDLAACRDRRRRQLDAECLLALLPGPEPGWVHLALVGHDLGLPAVTYVFGLAELGSRRAVVSWARLGEDDGRWEMGAVTQRRVLVEAVHELGHALGLPHCAVPTCAMHRSLWPESIDLKDAAYCPSCLAVVGPAAAVAGSTPDSPV